MIRIPAEPWWAKKGPLLAGFGIAGLLVLVGGGWFMTSYFLISDYQNKIRESHTATNLSISDALQTISDINHGQGSITYIEMVKTLNTALSGEITDFPQPPEILGVPLISDEQRLTDKAVKDKMVDFAAALNKTAQFLDYEVSVSSILNLPAQVQQGSDPKLLNARAQAWGEAAQQLSSLSPPYDLVTANQQIIKMVQAIAQSAAQIASSGGGNPFALMGPNSQLQSQISSLSGVYQLFDKINKQQSKAINDNLTQVQAALK